MARKKATEPQETTPSGSLGLFRCSEGDQIKCCFCPMPVMTGTIIFEVAQGRMSHFDCIRKMAKAVMGKRDERGASEDKDKNEQRVDEG